MPEAFTKINLTELEDVGPKYGFDHRWEARGARDALDCERTGAMYFRVHPGKRSPFMHRHKEAEEVYVVLSGSGRVKLGDEILDVAPLDAIRVAPSTPRGFEAGPDGLEYLAFGASHGRDGEPVEDPWTDD